MRLTMRLPAVLAIALALLLLLPLAHAVSLSDFLKPYLLPGESFRSESFQLLNSSFFLIKIFGQPYFLVEAKGGNFSLLSDENEIYAVLWERAVSNIDIEATKNASISLIYAFNSTRKTNEDECRRLTGVDRFPCTDKESCIVACRSVPTCGTALSYSLDSILAIQDWLETTGRFEAQLPAVISAHAIIGDNYEPSYVDAALEEENTLKSLALNISTNIIFHCGPGGTCYCPAPGLNFSILDSSKKLLASLHDSFTNLPLLQNTSKQIALMAAKRSDIRDEGVRHSLLLQELQDRIAETREEVDSSLIAIKDPVLKTKFNEAQSSLLSLTYAIGKKDYASAGSYSRTLYQQLDIINTRAAENKKSYEAILALHQNASNSLAALEALEPDEPFLSQADSLRAKFNETDVSAPIDRDKVQGIISGLDSIARDADAIYVALEGERLTSMLSRAESRFSELSLLVKDYKQSIDLTNISSSLRLARVLLEAGDVKAAEGTIANANAQMDALFPKAMKRSREIDAARQALAAAINAIGEASKVRFTFVQPDLSQANAQTEKATNALYTDPVYSAELANEAEKLARESVSKAASTDQLATIFGIFLGLMIIAGLLYWQYKREE